MAFGIGRNNQLDLRIGRVESLAQEKEYDIIIMNHVLEHLRSPHEAVRTVRKHLTERGIFYLGVPGLMNPMYYFSPTRSFLGMLHIAHLYHFTQRNLRRICSDFELLYEDSDIHAVFQKSLLTVSEYNADSASSEYDQTLLFLDYHERSFYGRLKRFVMVIRVFPSLLTVMFPEHLARAIRSLYHGICSLMRWNF